MTRKTPQALFLDRDGTLIEWVHYLSDPDQVRLCDGVAAALKRAKQAGCLLFMHTNQSGVGRGYFGLDAVKAVNRRMYQLLGVDESFFDRICIAADHPDCASQNSFRKPSPRFQDEMVNQFGLVRMKCFMLGDSLCDVETGLHAGMRSIYIRSRNELKCDLPFGVLEFETVSSFVESFFLAE